MAVTYSLSLTIRNDAITFGQVNEWIAELRIANTWHVAAEVEVELQNGSHKTNLQLSTKAIIWKWPTQFATNIYQLYSVGYLLCPAPHCPAPWPLASVGNCRAQHILFGLALVAANFWPCLHLALTALPSFPSQSQRNDELPFSHIKLAEHLKGKYPTKRRGVLPFCCLSEKNVNIF